jgi:hypothetical protein
MRALEALGDKKKFLSGICFSFGGKKISMVFEQVEQRGLTFQPRTNHDSDPMDHLVAL